MPTPFLPLTLESFDGKPLDSRASMEGESHYALVQRPLGASVRRSGGVCFHCRVRDAWFYSGEVVRLFAGYRSHNLIPRRVTGAWWPHGLQNRWRFVYRIEVGSIPTLSALFRWKPKCSKEVIVMSREQILKLTSLSSCAG